MHPALPCADAESVRQRKQQNNVENVACVSNDRDQIRHTVLKVMTPDLPFPDGP